MNCKSLTLLRYQLQSDYVKLMLLNYICAFGVQKPIWLLLYIRLISWRNMLQTNLSVNEIAEPTFAKLELQSCYITYVAFRHKLCTASHSDSKCLISFAICFWHLNVGNRSIVLNFYQQRPVFALKIHPRPKFKKSLIS